MDSEWKSAPRNKALRDIRSLRRSSETLEHYGVRKVECGIHR
jgi:hypothetical protein